jgi:asparagine synthase (glutamine-hydrolysing)
MCGIAAIVSRTPVPAYPIRQMMDLVRHRGPDDEGYLTAAAPGAPIELYGGPQTPADAFASGLAFSPTRHIDDAQGAVAVVSLGFRRLSILDLSVRGHQPMCTPDRRYWIVFNGEIYNYRALGEELAALGHRFISHCDTEVLLAAFAEWGTACFDRLNGMWAAVIYDAELSVVVASRDRFGIKPLYYWIAPDGAVCFASEIKQFTAVPGWRAAVNVARASEFLESGLTDHSDETLFDRVFQIRPGAFARVPLSTFEARADGRLEVERFYELRPKPFTGSFEDATAECRRLLTDSVRLMLRSDVPVGSCLSGGLDSSSIVCLSHQLLTDEGVTGKQRTFSALAPDTPIDERRWIDDVVSATSVDAYFTTPDPAGLERAAASLAWHQDEPFTSTSVFAQWCVFELAAANGMKVMLDGQGADEAFAGYHSFFAPYVAGLVRERRFGEAWAAMSELKRRHGFGHWRAIKGVGRIATHPSASPFASLSALSHAQLTSSNLQMLLRFEDRNSMAHSIEARVPFLDHRLVEFALGLPDAFKLGGGVTKRVMRSAMSGVLPDRIRDRVDKIGFETPQASWMTGTHRAWFRSELARSVEISDRFVPASTLVRFDALTSGRIDDARRPWRAIAFGQWMRAFAAAAPTRAQWQRA